MKKGLGPVLVKKRATLHNIPCSQNKSVVVHLFENVLHSENKQLAFSQTQDKCLSRERGKTRRRLKKQEGNTSQTPSFILIK
jgi:hypothetical protein